MTKFDKFILSELNSQLKNEGQVLSTGLLLKKSLTKAAILGPLAMIGSGYFFAALTTTRLLLIKTSMGLFSLKQINQGIVDIPFANIRSIKIDGIANQKKLTLQLLNNDLLDYRLNTWAKFTSGQRTFLPNLEHHFTHFCQLRNAG